MPPQLEVSAESQAVEPMPWIPPMSAVDDDHAFRRFGGKVAPAAIRSLERGVVEFARIERRRGAMVLRIETDDVAGLHPQQMPVDHEPRPAAGCIPGRIFPHPLDLDFASRAVSGRNRSQRRWRWSGDDAR